MKTQKLAKAGITLFVLLIFPLMALAQNKGGADTNIKVFVEVMPEFPGGQQAMVNFISENLKYPRKAEKNEIEGRVMVEFIVTKKGKIKNIRVVNKADPLLAKAAIKVVKKMPNWTPGTQDGKPVNVRFVLPIRFKLED